LVMDARFTDWYRTATIDLTSAPLEQRWKAVTNLAKLTTVTDLLTVVLLAHSQAVSADAVGLIHKHLHDADASVPARDNDLELRILAGSALMQILDPAHALSLLAAFYVESARFQRWSAAVSDIPDAAAVVLQSLSRSQRRAGSIEPPRLGLSADARAKLAESLKALPAVAAQPAVMEAIGAAVGSLPLIDDKAVAKGLAAAIEHSQQQYLALAEEVNILWWLYSEESSVIGGSWRHVSRPAACLIAAAELDKLTTFPTPHPSAPSFLAKVLSMTPGEGPVTLTDAINTSPEHWREQLVAEVVVAPSHVRLMPICVAAARRLESPDNSSWVASTEHVLGLKFSDGRDPSEIALQFGRELLIAKQLRADQARTR